MQGQCTYRVQIDQQLICKFDHDRLDGLAECLRKAADATEQSEWADFVLLDELKGG
jgi:hypothetical protein